MAAGRDQPLQAVSTLHSGHQRVYNKALFLILLFPGLDVRCRSMVSPFKESRCAVPNGALLCTRSIQAHRYTRLRSRLSDLFSHRPLSHRGRRRPRDHYAHSPFRGNWRQKRENMPKSGKSWSDESLQAFPFGDVLLFPTLVDDSFLD